LTTIAAVIFMLTSLLLTFSSTRKASTVMKERPAPTAPAAPSGIPVQPQVPQVPAPEPKK
jgi:preprotein translocase subunit SecG